MERITSFLERFTTLVPKDKEVKQKTIEALIEVLGITDIDPTSLSYQNNIMFVRVVGPIKHAIQLKKTEILECIKRKIGKNHPKDIR